MNHEYYHLSGLTLYVGQNLSRTSCLLSSNDFFSIKLINRKNDAVATGPYEICSSSVFKIAVRTFDTGIIFDVNFTHPYSVGATYNDPYSENRTHFSQSYVSK